MWRKVVLVDLPSKPPSKNLYHRRRTGMKFRSNHGMQRLLSPQEFLSLYMSALVSQQLPKSDATHLFYSVRGLLPSLLCPTLSPSKVHGDIHGFPRQQALVAHQCMHRHLHQRLHQHLHQRLHHLFLKLETDVTGENVALAHFAAASMTHAMQSENIAIGESVALEHFAAAATIGAMQSEIVAIGGSVVSGHIATVLMTDATRLATTH